MKHLLLLLLLALGGYFGWYYLNNRDKVMATIFMRRHLFAVLVIIAIGLLALMLQVEHQSTRVL